MEALKRKYAQDNLTPDATQEQVKLSSLPRPVASAPQDLFSDFEVLGHAQHQSRSSPLTTTSIEAPQVSQVQSLQPLHHSGLRCLTTSSRISMPLTPKWRLRQVRIYACWMTSSRVLMMNHVHTNPVLSLRRRMRSAAQKRNSAVQASPTSSFETGIPFSGQILEIGE